jgi:hypothetical protein
MKKPSIIKQISSFLLFALIIFITKESVSQQVITFKDGTTLKVFITSLSKDTVRYYLDNKPEVVYIERMSNVQNIDSAKTDSLTNILLNDKTYMHFKRATNTGIALLVTGAVIGTFGIIGYSSIEDPMYDINSFTGTVFSIVGIAAGTGLFITGTIITIIGSTNMQEYKQKMHGFSFDLKCTPHVKGVSLVYRF